ncbi:MAG: hypothetical protein M1819_001796 [Sarea resinae]|nr:MAG: hypothetical protein M1819_001796 [Sarea resinae]
MASKKGIVSSFVEGAPPGELSDVLADVKVLTLNEPSLLQSLDTDCEKYNQDQFTTVKLPGAHREVIISSYNRLEDGRYFDVESQSSFNVDHSTQNASGVQSYVIESQYSDNIKSLLKSLSTYANEHYPYASYGVYPIEHDSAIAIALVANKYSPNNFCGSLKGSVKVDVHYYEDGNVRLLTEKPVSVSLSASARAPELIHQIMRVEKKYQEDLNKAFGSLSDGAFKGLRRQLPITRQKIEWEKISTYRDKT